MTRLKAKKPGVRSIYFVINIALAIVLAFLLWQKFYEKTQRFNISYGEKPSELTTFIDNHFNHAWKHPHSIVYIFNKLPVLSDISDITKLYRKHRKNLNFLVVFHKRFKIPYPIRFPYKFLTNTKSECVFNGTVHKGNYFVLLKDQKLSHFDITQKILEMNFLIEKQVHPDKEYKDYAMSKPRLKNHLIRKLKTGNLNLVHLLTNKNEAISDFRRYSKIYFIIGGCTSCELKRLVNELKLRKMLDKKEELVIFPIFANEMELKPVVEEARLELPVYVDYHDQFDLFSIITGEKNKLIEIEAPELEMMGE